MLATLIKKPFDDKEWIFEIKWDGYRAIGEKNRQAQLFSRNSKPFSQFPTIVAELNKIPGKWMIDGEIVVLDKQGRSNFQLLQNYMRRKVSPALYYVFDILSLEGKDLTQLPLMQRREILKSS